MNDCIQFRAIGVIRSEHVSPAATPVQPAYAGECLGCVELRPELAAGLADIEGFSHVYLIYWLDRAEPPRLRVKPFLDDGEHGIFATRAPCRPNPIGLSLVRLLGREGATLYCAGVDILDGTPLLDIKPYAWRYDAVSDPRGGWTETLDDATARQRGRREYRPPGPSAGPGGGERSR